MHREVVAVDDQQTTLDRADRGLDHAPSDEQRMRPPLDPCGTVRATYSASASPHRRLCDVCNGRGYHEAKAPNGRTVGDIECSKCGGRGIVAANVSGELGNAVCDRGLDGSAARPSSASPPSTIGVRANVEAPAPTSCRTNTQPHSRELVADGVWCAACGWRKGGRDSWDGNACKCGLTDQRNLETADVRADAAIAVTAEARATLRANVSLARWHLRKAADLARAAGQWEDLATVRASLLTLSSVVVDIEVDGGGADAARR